MSEFLNVPTWAIWSGVAIAIGAVFTAYWARRTKISEFRQAWINDLREDVADYIGASEKWIRKWEELNDSESIEARSKRLSAEAFPLANEARVIFYRIQLRINPRANKYKDEDDAFLDSLRGLLDPSKIKPDQGENSWQTLADMAVEKSRELLKREWEVTKASRQL